MNKVIYFFSGTGNNLAVARTLSKLLEDTDILPITTLLTHKKIDKKYQIVGFCSPAYYCHIPPIVKKSMKNLIFTPTQRVFTIVCCSGNQGHSLLDLRESVNSSNKEVNQEFSLTFPGNNILLHDAYPKLYQKFLIKKAQKKLSKISYLILNNVKTKPASETILYKLANKNSLDQSIDTLHLKGSLFTINEFCIYCGRCAKLCPVDNIKVTYNSVTFSNKCQQCMSCIQWCPQHAINYLNQTQTRQQYHNPEIKLMDMLCISDEIDEADQSV